MKNKILSLLIAVLTVFSFLFAFTACEDNPEKGNENQTNNCMTEEEWIEALNKTYASTNHSMHSETTNTAEGLLIIDWKCDYINSVIYSNQKYYLIKDGNYLDDENVSQSNVSHVIEYYMERKGKTLNMFENENSVWYINENEYDTEEAAESYFLRFGRLSLDHYIFGGTGEYEGQELHLVEMYDRFYYDTQENIYTVQFSSFGLDPSLPGSVGSIDVEGTLFLKFAGGKLVCFAQEYTQGDSTHKAVYEIEYGTVVTIPEEIRNNAQERE